MPNVEPMEMRTAPTAEQPASPAHASEQTVRSEQPAERPADWRIARARRFNACSDVPVNYHYEIALDLVSTDHRAAQATVTELGGVLECDTDEVRGWLDDNPDEVDEAILFGPREKPCDACGALTIPFFVRPDYLAATGWLCCACEMARAGEEN